jgi:hypothetical protein
MPCADTLKTTRFPLQERLDFFLKAIRFSNSLTRLTNFRSIFSSIFECEKTEGGPFAYLQQEARSFLRLASPRGVELKVSWLALRMLT